MMRWTNKKEKDKYMKTMKEFLKKVREKK